MTTTPEAPGPGERRAWETLLGELPPLTGRTVLDLGCGVGEQAAALVDRGARVIGLDMNDERLERARSRGLAGTEFRKADLRTIPDLGDAVDGIWCSFAAAYFPDLPAALSAWRTHLRPGGWIAVIEIDDLFGHQPVSAPTAQLLQAYATEGLAAGRYDFSMGRKLADYLGRSGFRVRRVRTLDDPEFSRDGPLLPEALTGWRTRFEQMTLLRDFCGPQFGTVRREFLDCLSRDDHRATAKVYGCLATREAP